MENKINKVITPEYYVEDNIFLMCDCSNHMLQCQNDFEYNQINISMWHYGKSFPMSFKERLRWCWRILRTGNPWADSIVLSPKSAEELSTFITKQLNGKEK